MSLPGSAEAEIALIKAGIAAAVEEDINSRLRDF
jgi:hypothetical protein